MVSWPFWDLGREFLTIWCNFEGKKISEYGNRIKELKLS